jgi:RimJ/RimL family protein N-acetyltransferase
VTAPAARQPSHEPAFRIREARPSDAPALVKLAREVGSEPEGWLITTTDWRSAGEERRHLRTLRRYAHAAVFVAETGAGIVGRLSIGRDPHPASAHVADVGLMVAAGYRRRGIGQALLDAAVEWARRAGITKIELHVFPHNEPAFALYEQYGFQREGYRKRHYRRSEGFVDAILMAYEVD